MTVGRSVRDAAAAVRPAAAWLRGRIRDRVWVDARALAGLRIALGSLVLADLGLRARNLRAFYTDDGVLPTDALYNDYETVHSFHAWWGEPWIVAVLFVLGGVIAGCLLVGYRTRIATALTYVSMLSLQNRNPMVLNGGDVLLLLLLFWGIFLPLGARWSIDAYRKRERTAGVASIATFAILLQLVLVYVVNFVHKTKGEKWLDGTSVSYILALDQFTVYLGPHLTGRTGLLEFMTIGWLGLMAMAPFLLVLRGRPRALLATAFAGMHVGMLVTMKIGLFPLIVVAAVVPFYPPFVWDRLERAATAAGVAPRLAAAGERINTLRPRPRLRDVGGQRVRDIRWVTRVMRTTVVPGVFVLLVLATNAHVLGYADAPPEPARDTLEYTETDQSWRLFAPNPLSTTYWWVVPGTLADGERVDAMHGGTVDWDRPPNVAKSYETARWRKYLSNVRGTSNRNHRAYLANYLCDRWNRSHDVEMETVELWVLGQPERPYGGDAEVDRDRLLAYDCDGPLRQY